jgi:hypothetical protein
MRNNKVCHLLPLARRLLLNSTPSKEARGDLLFSLSMFDGASKLIPSLLPSLMVDFRGLNYGE